VRGEELREIVGEKLTEFITPSAGSRIAERVPMTSGREMS